MTWSDSYTPTLPDCARRTRPGMRARRCSAREYSPRPCCSISSSGKEPRMGLDIRIPLGVMFTLLGLLLTGFGFFSDPAIYQRSEERRVGKEGRSLQWRVHEGKKRRECLLRVSGILMFP